ncbi:MAG: Crp/Fnr family transcriptional regulator [Gammaproteobacteria bacterium]|nr:Crp/Fnr family transcriptional regulator [Gammaproteobacteria bacterium]
MQTPWFIPPSDFWGRLSGSARAVCSETGQRHSYNKGQVIFPAGAPADHVYILLDGRTKIYALSGLGRAVILWFCFPGEVFGLAEVTRAARREVYAEACAKTTVLAIPQRAFMSLIEAEPTSATLLIELLSCRMRGLTSMLVNLTNDDVTTRVVKLLVRLRARYGKTQCDDVSVIDIPLTHQEIADMIGTTRQSVNAVLNELKRQGLLTMQNQYIQIHSEQQLYHMINQLQSTADDHPQPV